MGSNGVKGGNIGNPVHLGALGCTAALDFIDLDQCTGCTVTSVCIEGAQGIIPDPSSNVRGDYMRLPASVQEIADVIGRETALYLIGQLPTCYAGADGKRSTRVILYVPKRLPPNHRLVEILGWHTALQLVEGFGGEILQPANCQEVYRRFRDSEARRLVTEGLTATQLAEVMAVSERHIRNIAKEIPQEALASANDNRAQE